MPEQLDVAVADALLEATEERWRRYARQQETRGVRAWGPGAGGAGGGRGRVCLRACVARVGVCVCGRVRPDAGYMSGGLPSVPDLTLGKPLLCRVSDQGHSTNLVFFYFLSFPSFS